MKKSLTKLLVLTTIMILTGFAHNAYAQVQQRVLAIPQVNQHYHFGWCWAAAAENVFGYHNVRAPQNLQADNRLGYCDCSLNALVNNKCNTGGLPQYHNWGFNYTNATSDPLSFDVIKAQIDAGLPVIAYFAGHAFAINGYSDDGTTQYVYYETWGGVITKEYSKWAELNKGHGATINITKMLPPGGSWLQPFDGSSAPGRNYALGKPAWQSSTDNTLGGDAGHAVDGNWDGTGDFNCNSVTSTTNATGIHWWSVDLGEVKTLRKIVIFTRIGAPTGHLINGDVNYTQTPDPLYGVTVKVSNDRDFNSIVWQSDRVDVLQGPWFHGDFPGGTQGRYVRIETDNGSHQVRLQLTEVGIYGPSPTLEFWLDGSDPAGNGINHTGPITTWVDKSGNNFHAAGGTGAGYNPTGLNGKGVVTFDGTQYLEAPLNWSNFNTAEDYTAFTVFNTSTPATHGFVWANRPGNGPDHYTQNQANGLARVRFFGGQSTPGGQVGDGAGHIVVYGRNNGQTFYPVDCREYTAPVPGTYSRGTTTTIGNRIKRDNRSYDFFNGSIAEIIIFRGSMSAFDRNNVIAYLAEKWGTGAVTCGIPSAGKHLMTRGTSPQRERSTLQNSVFKIKNGDKYLRPNEAGYHGYIIAADDDGSNWFKWVLTESDTIPGSFSIRNVQTGGYWFTPEKAGPNDQVLQWPFFRNEGRFLFRIIDLQEGINKSSIRNMGVHRLYLFIQYPNYSRADAYKLFLWDGWLNDARFKFSFERAW